MQLTAPLLREPPKARGVLVGESAEAMTARVLSPWSAPPPVSLAPLAIYAATASIFVPTAPVAAPERGRAMDPLVSANLLSSWQCG